MMINHVHFQPTTHPEVKRGGFTAKFKRLIEPLKHRFQATSSIPSNNQRLKGGSLSPIITHPNVPHGAVKYSDTSQGFYYIRTKKINVFPFKCVLCEPQLCSQKPDALVLVNTRPDAFGQRQAIRDTWGLEVREGRCYGRSLSGHVAVGFVVGLQNNTTVQTKIEVESNVYHDIIQGDFIDHYTNLTFKSLLAMHWTEKYCSKAKHFIKSDDDMVINFPYLFQVLNQGNFIRSIMGPYLPSSEVWRQGKWKVTEKQYPFSRYPPYEAGSAYVITMDLIRPLLEASQYYPYFPIDDVYITGVLAKHVQGRHVVRRGFSVEETPKPSACDFINNIRFTGHNYTAAEMRKFWMFLRNTTCTET